MLLLFIIIIIICAWIEYIWFAPSPYISHDYTGAVTLPGQPCTITKFGAIFMMDVVDAVPFQSCYIVGNEEVKECRYVFLICTYVSINSKLQCLFVCLFIFIIRPSFQNIWSFMKSNLSGSRNWDVVVKYVCWVITNFLETSSLRKKFKCIK